MDVGGRTLNIELTCTGFDYRSWFESMVDELGVEVVVTDDSTDYSASVSDVGLFRQQCLVRMDVVRQAGVLRTVRRRLRAAPTLRYPRSMVQPSCRCT